MQRRNADANEALHDVLSLEAFLPYRLNRLADTVSRAFAETYRNRLGLTRPEWRVFATLGQYGTMTATGIGNHSAMHKTKVSRAVAALEQRKWLARHVDAADRRVERLRLTAAGTRVYAEMVPLARSFEDTMLERLTDEERHALLDGLAALEKAIMPERRD